MPRCGFSQWVIVINNKRRTDIIDDARRRQYFHTYATLEVTSLDDAGGTGCKMAPTRINPFLVPKYGRIQWELIKKGYHYYYNRHHTQRVSLWV